MQWISKLSVSMGKICKRSVSFMGKMSKISVSAQSALMQMVMDKVKDSQDKHHTAKHNYAFLDCYEFLGGGTPTRFKEVRKLAGFLLAADFVYAGVVVPPTVDEVGRIIRDLNKGGVRALELMHLITPREKGTGRAWKMANVSKVRTKYTQLYNFLDTRLTDSQKLKMIFNMIMVENGLLFILVSRKDDLPDAPLGAGKTSLYSWVSLLVILSFLRSTKQRTVKMDLRGGEKWQLTMVVQGVSIIWEDSPGKDYNLGAVPLDMGVKCVEKLFITGGRGINIIYHNRSKFEHAQPSCPSLCRAESQKVDLVQPKCHEHQYIARLQEFERGPAGDGLDMLEEIDAVCYSLSHHRDPVGFNYNPETATEGYLDALGRFIRDTGLKWAPHDDETATTDGGLSESSATGANKRNESTPSQAVEVDLSPSRQQAPKKKKVTIRSKGKAKVAEYDSDVTESDTETEIDMDKTESDTDAEEIGPTTV
ncbi:hypothetical protein C8R44DRAFT_727100 [Mycena epipterygia]|nr:hypothetical protein C8R44DRAFT_727100 [Mycena epipterygia]